MISNFSLRQRLHLLLELLNGECDARMRQEIRRFNFVESPADCLSSGILMLFILKSMKSFSKLIKNLLHGQGH